MNRRGISPIVATVIVIAVTLVAAVLIGYFAFNCPPKCSRSEGYPSGVDANTRIYQTKDPNRDCASGFIKMIPLNSSQIPLPPELRSGSNIYCVKVVG